MPTTPFTGSYIPLHTCLCIDAIADYNPTQTFWVPLHTCLCIDAIAAEPPARPNFNTG